MKKRSFIALPARRGYSLVELLVVVAIIAILAGIVLGISGFASRKSAVGRAVSDLETIKMALEEYRLERGSYPTNVGPIHVGTFSNDVGRYAASGFRVVDPWGNGYNYLPKGNRPYMSYRLYSFGASTNASVTYDDIDSASGSF